MCGKIKVKCFTSIFPHIITTVIFAKKWWHRWTTYIPTIHKKKGTKPVFYCSSYSIFWQKMRFLDFGWSKWKKSSKITIFLLVSAEIRRLQKINYLEIAENRRLQWWNVKKRDRKNWNPDTSSGIHDFWTKNWLFFSYVPSIKQKIPDFVIFRDFWRFWRLHLCVEK